MALVKAHIALNDTVFENPDALDATVAEIRKVSGVFDVNEKRLARYGILTGAVDDSKLAAIRTVPGVQSVEIDGVRVL
ncbi:MAG: hypothetical protein K2X35_23425 [Bryobacteraceae bacterium]|nr:hypothetical protein [Bryobacteraceae bacterium]